MHYNSKVVTSSEVGLVYSCDFNSILRPEQQENYSQQRSTSVVHPPILSETSKLVYNAAALMLSSQRLR